MSASVKSPLWLEGFQLFGAQWQEWAKLAVWFFVALAIVQIVGYDPAMQEAAEKLRDATKAHQQLTPEQMDSLQHMLGSKGGMLLAVLVLSFLQGYVYMVLFLKQKPVIGTPEFSARRFFFTLWKEIQMVLVITATGVVCMGVPFFVMTMLKESKSALIVVPIILAIIGSGFFYYVIFKYILVAPLAVIGTESALKTSWSMTRGNWWRVFGNCALFGIVILLLMILMLLIEKGIVSALISAAPQIFGTVLPDTDVGPANVAANMIRFFSPIPRHLQGGIGAQVGIAFGALNTCVLAGLGKAFHCAILRVLYHEQYPSIPA